MTVLLPEGSDKTINIVYPEVLELVAPVAQRPVREYDKFESKPDFE